MLIYAMLLLCDQNADSIGDIIESVVSSIGQRLAPTGTHAHAPSHTHSAGSALDIRAIQGKKRKILS
jgi:hypothetical protein